LSPANSILQKKETKEEKKKKNYLSYDRAIDIYLRVKERNVSGLV
jgi:hypothetical protein